MNHCDCVSNFELGVSTESKQKTIKFIIYLFIYGEINSSQVPYTARFEL